MSEKDKSMPWRNAEFEKKFREAMGREMTQQEREFFGLNGLDEQSRSEESESGPNIPSDKGQFAWEALRRVSALID